MADNFTVTRIPELAELQQKDGTLYLPVYKQDDDKTYRILVDLLGGATDTTLQWSSSETYQTGDIIEWNLKLWKSKIDNNTGNVPAENTNWTEVSKSEGSNSINYWNAGVYTINPTLTLYDNNLYLLDASQVSMPFESTDFLAEKTAGIWLQLTGNDIDAFVGTGALSNPVYSTDTTANTVTVNQNDFVVYENQRFRRVSVPQKTMPLTLESEQFVVVRKVSGSWVYDITTVVADIDATHIAAIPVLTINFYTLAGVKTVHTIDWNTQALNGVNRNIDIRVKERRFRRLSGLGITINASRQVTISGSQIGYGLNKLDIPEANSLSHSMHQAVWNGTAWVWTKITALNNTQYQGSTGLLTLDNNEYGCYFVFRGVEIQRHIYVLFGNGSFTLEQARLQDFPSNWPTLIDSHAMPVARVIYGKGLNTPEILTPYGGVLGNRIGSDSGSPTTVHGDLTGRDSENQHPAAAIQHNSNLPNIGITAPAKLNIVLEAIDDKIGGIDSSLWEPELITAATTEHPRWDDSLDANIYGIDKFGFGALPGGYRNLNGTYDGLGNIMFLGTKTQFSSTNSWYRNITSDISGINRYDNSKNLGVPQRLVRAYTPTDGTKTDGRILPGTFTDGDGNTYDGVIIGDQVWSTTNLKTTTYADGTTPIPTGYSDVDWSNLTTGAYAVYPFASVAGIDSEAEMIAAYGLLYNWYAVDNVLGLATNGSVPTDAQFTQLTDYIIANYPEIDSTNIGDALKSIRQVNSPFEAESDIYIKPKDNDLTSQQRYAGTEYLRQKTALPNIETAVEEEVSTIFGNINARLFEQIAFSLTGYGDDITLTSQDITLSPYTFTAQKLAVHMNTAPTGSNAIVTFYHNGVSIGTVTITAGTKTGSTSIADVNVSENDTMSAVVTAVGTTIPGATAKAYIQGIKTQ